MVNKIILETKSDFIENLTHDCYIVQVERITNRYQTKLDKLLSLFEQNNFTDDSKIIKEYTHEIDSEEIKLSTEILHYSGTNTEERKKNEIEQETWRSVNAMFETQRNKYIKKIDDLEFEIIELRKNLNEQK